MRHYAVIKAHIHTQNDPKYVWWLGSTRTHWGRLSAAPNLLATMGVLILREGRKGREGVFLTVFLHPVYLHTKKRSF